MVSRKRLTIRIFFTVSVILKKNERSNEMTEDAKILENVRQNAEMGIDGINAVRKKVKNEQLLALLDSQRGEYRDILNEAGNRLHDIGAPVEGSGEASKMYTKMFSAAKSFVYICDSEIAEDMIKGTSSGITKLTRQLNACEISSSTRGFAEKLVKTEEKNIEELKKFL